MFHWLLNMSLFPITFPLAKEANGKINSLSTFYTKKLKMFSDSKKSGAALDGLNGPIFLELI